MTRPLVSNASHVETNIRAYQGEVERNAELAGRIRQHTAWYAIGADDGQWLFGPSKFVGYEKMTAGEYLAIAAKGGGGNGRLTERELEKWFEQVSQDNPRYRELREAFELFARRFGKSPNERWRVSVQREAANRRSQKPANLWLRVFVDPKVCGGKPCIKGTRMRVSDILAMMSEGIERAEILQDYPYLENADIDASLAWAANTVDHRIIRAA